MTDVRGALQALREDGSYDGRILYADLSLASVDDAIARVERNAGLVDGAAAERAVEKARRDLVSHVWDYNRYARGSGLPLIDSGSVVEPGGLERSVSDAILDVWDNRRV